MSDGTSLDAESLVVALGKLISVRILALQSLELAEALAKYQLDELGKLLMASSHVPEAAAEAIREEYTRIAETLAKIYEAKARLYKEEVELLNRFST